MAKPKGKPTKAAAKSKAAPKAAPKREPAAKASAAKSKAAPKAAPKREPAAKASAAKGKPATKRKAAANKPAANGKPSTKRKAAANRPAPSKPAAKKPGAKKLAAKRQPRKQAEAPNPPLPILDELGAASRPVIAGDGEHLVLCAGASLRFHTVDKPIRHIHHDTPFVAVARSATRSAALDHHGVLHLYDDAGELVAARPAGDGPRSLTVLRDGRFAALVDGGLAIVDGAGSTTELVDYPRPIAAAADPSGALVIAGEGRRLAEWTGRELIDIPETIEQIVAVAALGGRRFLCVGQHHTFVLDLAQRELEHLTSAPTHVATSPDGSHIAVNEGGAVNIGKLAEGKLTFADTVYYGGTYITPEESMTVHGLAFLDDDRVAIALDAGRGNIIDVATKQTLKLDPQPGDPTARWIFIYNGQILIAD